MEPSPPFDMYLPKSGILLPLDSPPRNGLVYDDDAPLSGRMAVTLSARTAAGAVGLRAAADLKRQRREAVESVAMVCGSRFDGWTRAEA